LEKQELEEEKGERKGKEKTEIVELTVTTATLPSKAGVSRSEKFLYVKMPVISSFDVGSLTNGSIYMIIKKIGRRGLHSLEVLAIMLCICIAEKPSQSNRK
jgi:hypothetical protein